MAKHWQQKNSLGKENNSGGLRLKPHIRRAREARIKKQGMTFLQEINFLIKKGSPKGLSRGRGVYKFSSNRFSQRVIIKTRTVRTKGHGQASLKAHLDYIQREGVGIDGTEAIIFSGKDLERGDIANLSEEWGKDRHHFRLIISPEKGSELDLKMFSRDFVKQMEQDLKTPLQWIGIEHHNTDNPHIHLTIRGRDDHGADLVINGDYISRGMRSVAERIATRELGLKTEHELQLEIINGLEKLRVTGLDRSIEKEAQLSNDRLLDLRYEAIPQNDFVVRNFRNKRARLEFLERSGLTVKVDENIWRVKDGFLDKLQDYGLQNDIIKNMHKEMQGVELKQDINFIKPENFCWQKLEGKVIHVGQSDELFERKYMLLQTPDNKIYHASISKFAYYDEIIKVGNDIEIKGIAERGREHHKFLSFAPLGRSRSKELGLSKELGVSRELGLGFGFGF